MSRIQKYFKDIRILCLKTAISFECTVPSTSEFKERVIKTLEKYPYYVALLNDKIVGYTYAAPFCEREAYRFSAALTIYIDKRIRH